MIGKIIKGIAGFYYIHTPNMGVYECKAKGIFRNQKIKPLVGDNVEIDVIDEREKKGNIIRIIERKNELIRPAVSNIDQALIIFAGKNPMPNLNLLDRFLIMMNRQQVKTIICFNKSDIVSEEEKNLLVKPYELAGYEVIFTSTILDKGIEDIKQLLQDKTTVFAGPSGVGKSSILNMICPDANMEIGCISEKIKRGKHTTRHSELFNIDNTTYIMDTPGFSSIYIDEIDKDELKEYFLEFTQYDRQCKFQGCVHVNEPSCAVKEAVQQDKISEKRYKNYLDLYHELKNIKRY